MVLVERNTLNTQSEDKIKLLGYGESSDSYHMSSPHPDGLGVISSMEGALSSAMLSLEDVDYINLHGTASKLNDKFESKGVYSMFADTTPSSSTKGFTGHTLGASGVVEAIISALCIKNNFKPKSKNTSLVDPEINIKILQQNETNSVNTVLSNSCGFGGSNCSLLIGRN